MKYPTEPQPSAPSAPFFDGSQACAGVDLRIFFPTRGNNAKRAVAAAKDICSSCVFLAPCLDYAMANRLDGVWGHTTSAERTAIRHRRHSPDFFQAAA